MQELLEFPIVYAQEFINTAKAKELPCVVLLETSN